MFEAPMNTPRPSLPASPEKRSSGPQGTRLFAQEDLRALASGADGVSAGRASVHKPVLESVGPELGGRRFSVHSGRQTIGRLASNDIVVSGPSVSSSHAWITNQQGRCSITNTLSTNGTFVNGKRIHQATLRHGDRVRLGEVELVFLTRDRGSPDTRRLVRLAVALIVLSGLAVLAWRLLGSRL
jgi:pSer/pThr/pTyr-binding forkhead associated (FHA) protein